METSGLHYSSCHIQGTEVEVEVHGDVLASQFHENAQVESILVVLGLMKNQNNVALLLSNKDVKDIYDWINQQNNETQADILQNPNEGDFWRCGHFIKSTVSVQLQYIDTTTLSELGYACKEILLDRLEIVALPGRVDLNSVEKKKILLH